MPGIDPGVTPAISTELVDISKKSLIKNGDYSLKSLINLSTDCLGPQVKANVKELMARLASLPFEFHYRLEYLPIITAPSITPFNPYIKSKTIVYLLSHFSIADISLFKDFEEIKPLLKILRKTVITQFRPVRIQDVTLYLRDTSELAPGGASLDAISKMYEGIPKLEVSKK